MKMWSMRKQSGSVGDLMITGICILAMTAVMLAYVDSVSLLKQKDDVGQLARRYILRMETVGYLTAGDRTLLTADLEAAGVTEIDYTGTTLSPVTYGEMIALEIKGKLEGKYDFTEKRISTAKN